MIDRLFKAICSDFDMFGDMVLLVTIIPVFGLWHSTELTKMYKLLYCGALFFAVIAFLVLCELYFPVIAKKKGIKFVRRAKDSYRRDKWHAIIFFAGIGISFILFSPRNDVPVSVRIKICTMLLPLSLLLVLLVEKRHYRKKNK